MSQIIDQVVCLNIDCSIWSGRKKLTPADFRNTGSDDLPPADLASLGSKKICNPAALRIFDTLKKQAHREAAKVGIRFLGGYAIPETKAQDLAKVLDDIREQFDEARAKFVNEYDDEIDKWVAKHPNWSASIRAVVPSSSHVESRIGFDYQAFEVKASGITTAGLDRAVNGLADQLYYEVAREAFDYYDISLCGKPYGTQKTLRPLRSIRSKLEGLSFIDGTVTPIISMIDHVLESMPAKGHIEGADLAKLVGVVHILSDKARMLTYGQRVLEGANPASFFAEEEEADDDSVLALVSDVDQTVPVPVVTDLSSLFTVPETTVPSGEDLTAAMEANTAPAVQSQPQTTAVHASTFNAINSGFAGMVGEGSLDF